MFFPSLGQGRLLIDSACLFVVKVSIYQKTSHSVKLVLENLLASLSDPEGMDWMYCSESLPRIQKQIFVQLVISNMWFHYYCGWREEHRAFLKHDSRRFLTKFNWGPFHLGVFRKRRRLGASTFISKATDSSREELNLLI